MTNTINTLASAALRRLMRDLKEITNEPIQGVSAAPVNDNLFVWHGNLDASLLRGADGVAFHYIMTFSENYPKSPPAIQLCTNIPHYNVFYGGSFICLDMLEIGEWSDEYEKSMPYTGWSSCYTVRSLLMQLQSFLMEEQRIFFGSMPPALEIAKSFRCSTCGHKSGNVWPPFATPAKVQAAAEKIVVKIPNFVTMLPTSFASRNDKWEKSPSPATIPTARRSDGWTVMTHKSSPKNANRVDTRVNRNDTVAVTNRFALLLSMEEKKTYAFVAGQKPKPGAQVQGSEGKEANGTSKNRAKSQKGTQYMPPTEAKPIDISAASCSSSASKLVGNIITPGAAQGSLGNLPYEVLISVIMRLPSAKDILSVASTCRFLHNVVEDGWMWKEVFSKQYPKSKLTAASMRDWKYAYAMEHNNIIAETVCFHTKKNIDEEILGIPITYTTDYNKKVNYIYSTMDFIGLTAYRDENVRKTVWKKEFTLFMPLYFTQDHFMRSVEVFEKSILRLSLHWNQTRFDPKMVLEVLPKLMNSYIVQLTKEDAYASERAVHGYFLIYRLLIGALEIYPRLNQEIYRRVQKFVTDEEARDKINYPSLGDFIPLVTMSQFSWDVVAPAVLSEMFDRNAQWVCKAHPELANVRVQVTKTQDPDRLKKSFEATIVSSRLFMFHVYFMRTFRRKPLTAMAAELDRFYGQPTAAVTRSFQAQIKRILAVKTWPEFFAFIHRPCPSPLELTRTLKQSIRNSQRRGYHNRDSIYRRPKKVPQRVVTRRWCQSCQSYNCGI